MYGKMFEQAESFLKPMNDIWALNVEVLDTLKSKQTDLFNEVVEDTFEFAKGMIKPDMNIDSIVDAQQSYWEELGSKISNNAQDNIALLSGVQEKVGDVFKVAIDTSSIDATNDAAIVEAKPVKSTPKKKAAAKKAPAKAETKSAPPVVE